MNFAHKTFAHVLEALHNFGLLLITPNMKPAAILEARICRVGKLSYMGVCGRLCYLKEVVRLSHIIIFSITCYKKSLEDWGMFHILG